MDTVANLLNSVINAQRVEKKHVVVPYSRFSKELLDFLAKKEMIGKVRVQDSPIKKLVVSLRYHKDGRPTITGVQRVSKPGRRVYAKGTEMPYTRQDRGFIVVSTSTGLMDEKSARGKNLGGELLCEIW